MTKTDKRRQTNFAKRAEVIKINRETKKEKDDFKKVRQ
jgi:hypothetical protein